MSADDHQGESAATTTVPATILWIVVSAGLLYGIVETAREASALFGGG